MREVCAPLVRNTDVGPRLFEMEFSSPELADEVLPGQFVHVKLNGFDSHILRRPISVYKVNKDEGTLTLLVQEVGEGTAFLHLAKPGTQFNMLGPVGTGWSEAGNKKILVVGGGVGAAPLFMHAQRSLISSANVTVVLGAQTKESMVTYTSYEELFGSRVLYATDDGTFGVKGFCTTLVEEELKTGSYDYVYVCGPEPLMKIVASLANKYEVACEVSMEKRMACGVGACLSCVVETTDGKKRACVDGPVFDAQKVVW